MSGRLPHLEPKPPREDAARREHQKAVKNALIVLPAFGLRLVAARVRAASEREAGYENYTLPNEPAELAFTLKGALRLEMMNSKQEEWQKYRRLFGSNTKAHDLSAWRSRVYVQAYANGAAAAEAAQMMLLSTTVAPADFLAKVAAQRNTIVLLQVDDVFLDEGRRRLFSDLLIDFLNRQSRLLAYVANLRVLPAWQEEAL